MIYFVQPVEGGPVKIGFSDNVKARVKQIEGMYRKRLRLLAELPGGREEEKAIHQRFAKLRIKQTEQFRPAPELFDFIGIPMMATADYDAVKRADDRRLVKAYFSERDHLRLRLAGIFDGVSAAAFVEKVVIQALDNHAEVEEHMDRQHPDKR